MKIFFWGAGRIGTYWLKQWRDFGIEPKGVIDNNRDLWGSMLDGIMIYNPSILKEASFDYVFITCNMEGEICEQLLEIGIVEDKIVTGGHNILNHMLYYASENMTNIDKTNMLNNAHGRRIVLFDLYNGMVLGGVEAWSYDLAKCLDKQGYQGKYLTTDAAGPIVTDETYPAYMLRYREVERNYDKIETCITEITKSLPCTIICNFPQHIFWAACIAKRFYPEQIRIVAIQHSDDSLYYNAFTRWQKYIDRCMVISSRIEEKLLAFGMEQTKIGHLEWQVSCKENLDRTWSEKGAPLQIGYAGRVTVRPKRLDLLFALTEMLKRRKVEVRITIAGAGDYGETLKEKIEKENLQDRMKFIGQIKRENIPDFWKKQDIMISCSEWEGHSISQAEAMAEGAVPVITDVSGARDDVTDGYNGFVVEIGDIETMAEKIAYLYHNPAILKQMGMRAHDTIYRRQNNMDQGVFWEGLIEKVWQS